MGLCKWFTLVCNRTYYSFVFFRSCIVISCFQLQVVRSTVVQIILCCHYLSDPQRRRTINIKEGVDVARLFIQSKFCKPGRWNKLFHCSGDRTPKKFISVLTPKNFVSTSEGLQLTSSVRIRRIRNQLAYWIMIFIVIWRTRRKKDLIRYLLTILFSFGH